MIELTQRQVVEVVPVGTPVVGDVDAAVGADDHVAAVLRIDPQRVVVGVNAARGIGGERLTAVLGWAHSGSLTRYVAWSLLGVGALLYAL